MARTARLSEHVRHSGSRGRSTQIAPQDDFGRGPALAEMEGGFRPGLHVAPGRLSRARQRLWTEVRGTASRDGPVTHLSGPGQWAGRFDRRKLDRWADREIESVPTRR